MTEKIGCRLNKPKDNGQPGFNNWNKKALPRKSSFGHKNLAERDVILLNCPKGQLCNFTSRCWGISWVGNVGQKAVNYYSIPGYESGKHCEG